MNSNPIKEKVQPLNPLSINDGLHECYACVGPRVARSEEQDRMRKEAQVARRVRIDMYQELLVVMYGEGAYGTEEPDEGEAYPDSEDCSHYYLYGIKNYHYV